MALTSLNKRTYDLRGSRIYMHTESTTHRGSQCHLLRCRSGVALSRSKLSVLTVSVFRFKTDRFAVCRFETDRFETVRFAVLNFRFNRFRFDRFAVLPFSVSVSMISVLHRFDSVLIPFWQDSVLAPFCRFRFDSVLQMSVLMSVLPFFLF